MNISSIGNNVTIKGNIKSMTDFQDIKTHLDSLAQSNSDVIITVEDSISITSSVIGYLNKLVLKDKISLQLKVGSDELMELLDDLNLTQTFRAVRI